MAELLPCQAVGWLAVKGSTSGAAADERLRTAIVALELGPGTEVSEAQLVDGFGVSKAAVRAAPARLRGEGLGGGRAALGARGSGGPRAAPRPRDRAADDARRPRDLRPAVAAGAGGDRGRR